MEACKAFGGDWQRWNELPLLERAKLIAHEMELRMREVYVKDMISRDSKEKSESRGESTIDAERRKLFFNEKLYNSLPKG